MNAPTFPQVDLLRAIPDAVMPEEPVLPLSVEGYHALLQAGILQSGDPIELLEGFMVRKMTKGSRHERTRRQLRRHLEKLIQPGYFVDEQGAMTTTTSESEPDVFVIRGDIDDFSDRHAGPDEVALVAEVAESSLHRDRHLKQRVYARAGIATYWVVNLVNDCVEVMTQPSGNVPLPSFGQTAVYRAGDELPVVIAGQQVGTISVAELLAPPKGKA
jgi:hypothetical protein